MKNWQIAGFFVVLILGFLLMSGSTSTGSTSAAAPTQPTQPTQPTPPTTGTKTTGTNTAPTQPTQPIQPTTVQVANDFQTITNESGSDVPIAQMTQQSVNLTSKNEQIKAFAESIRKIQNTGTIPIIDVEFHYDGGMDLGKIIDNMNRNGVALTWLGPNEIQGSEESIRLNKLYPDKFVPTTISGDGPLWHGSAPNFLDNLNREVRSGNYFAMSEFEGRHYPSDTNNRDVHMPVNSTAFEIVFRASSDTGVPFLIHQEAEDAMLPEAGEHACKISKGQSCLVPFWQRQKSRNLEQVHDPRWSKGVYK